MGTYRERLRTNLNHRGHLKSPHKCHFHHGERWLKSLCLGLMWIRRFQGTYLIWELVINQGRIPKGILLFLSSFHSVDNTSLVCVLSHSVMSDSLRPKDCSLRGSSVHGNLQARILEWVAMLSSRGSSQPKDQTQVFCIAGRFFTVWATKEAQYLSRHYQIPSQIKSKKKKWPRSSQFLQDTFQTATKIY